jgi:hypothetical protein
MRTILAGVACLVLPESHREPILRQYSVNVPFWSFFFGIFELVLGFALFMYGGFQYVRTYVFVPQGWIEYFLTPRAWFFAIVTVTGLVRMGAFVANREAVGEPWVWGAIRVSEWVRGQAHHRRETREFAPIHLPDRALCEGDKLIIMSPRKKVDWDDLVTIKVGERFYRLVNVEERLHGSWKVVAHILEEIGEDEPIRRLVHAEVELPTV